MIIQPTIGPNAFIGQRGDIVSVNSNRVPPWTSTKVYTPSTGTGPDLLSNLIRS